MWRESKIGENPIRMLDLKYHQNRLKNKERSDGDPTQ